MSDSARRHRWQPTRLLCPWDSSGKNTEVGCFLLQCMHACKISRFSRVRLCAILWTAAHQAPLSTGFSRQEYWSGLPFPSPKPCLPIHNFTSDPSFTQHLKPNPGQANQVTCFISKALLLIQRIDALDCGVGEDS